MAEGKAVFEDNIIINLRGNAIRLEKNAKNFVFKNCIIYGDAPSFWRSPLEWISIKLLLWKHREKRGIPENAFLIELPEEQGGVKGKDLFDFVSEKVNFRSTQGKPINEEKPENITWTCHHDLRFVKEFCERHSIPNEQIISELKAWGGYCDCEVLWNAVDHIDGDRSLQGSVKK